MGWLFIYGFLAVASGVAFAQGEQAQINDLRGTFLTLEREADLIFNRTDVGLDHPTVARISEACGVEVVADISPTAVNADIPTTPFELRVQGADQNGVHCAIDRLLRVGFVALDLLEMRASAQRVDVRLAGRCMHLPARAGPSPGQMRDPLQMQDLAELRAQTQTWAVLVFDRVCDVFTGDGYLALTPTRAVLRGSVSTPAERARLRGLYWPSKVEVDFDVGVR